MIAENDLKVVKQYASSYLEENIPCRARAGATV
jgi:hypothetical protein